MLSHVLAQSKQASIKYLGTTLRQVKSPLTLEDRLREEGYTTVDGVAEPEALPFRDNKLWVTVWERRGLASDELDDAIADAYQSMSRKYFPDRRAKSRTPWSKVQQNRSPNPLPAKLAKVQTDLELPAGNLTAPVTAIVRTERQEISGLSFFAFQIEPASLALRALRLQRAVIDETASAIRAPRLLVSSGFAFETPPDEGQVSFMIAPETEATRVDRFLDAMNTQLLEMIERGPGLELELDERTRWVPSN